MKSRTIVVLGPAAVGKSAITIQFVEGRFPEIYHSTIETTFEKVVRFKGEDYNTKITDTAGQHEHSVIRPKLCSGVHGFVIVYSVASRASLDLCALINQKLLNAVGFDSVPRVLVGNMTDLQFDRQVSTEEGRKQAEEWGCAFVECSAKNGANVNDVFAKLMTQIQNEQEPDHNTGRTTCSVM